MGIVAETRNFRCTIKIVCTFRSLLLLGLKHLLAVLRPSLEPPCANENSQATDDNTGVVHVGGLNRHDIREREEHDGESKPAHRDSVDDGSPGSSHVEHSTMHVLSSREQVGQDWKHVRNVVNGDRGTQQRVESRR